MIHTSFFGLFYNAVRMTPEDKKIYSIVLVVIFIIILIVRDDDLPIYMIFLGVLSLLALDRQCDDPDDLYTSMPVPMAAPTIVGEDDDLLNVYRTAPQKATFYDPSENPYAMFEDKPTSAAPAAPAAPADKKEDVPVPKPKPAEKKCDDPLYTLLNDRTNDGNLNFISHAKNKFRVPEQKKMSVDMIKKYWEEEIDLEQDRHWWGNYEE